MTYRYIGYHDERECKSFGKNHQFFYSHNRRPRNNKAGEDIRVFEVIETESITITVNDKARVRELHKFYTGQYNFLLNLNANYNDEDEIHNH